MKIARTTIIIALAIAGIAGIISPSFAVDEIARDRYFPEYQGDPDMSASELPQSFAKRGIQYGGWIMPVIMDQRNDDESLTTGMVAARLWIKSYLWSHSFIYLRGKNIFLGVINQEGYGLDNYSNVVDLDVGFIEISNRRHSVTLTLGRKFFLLGSGLLLDNRADGLEFSFRTGYINGMIFGAYTGFIFKDDNPFGLSDKDISEGARRVLAGGSLSTDFYNQTFYVHGMIQVDFGMEYEDLKSRYDSYYFGAGMNGVLFSRLFYYAEFDYEMGKSILAGTSQRKNIYAMAGIFNAYYYFETLLNPVAIVQYAFGSGDSSRDNYHSPTGNYAGNDTGFLYFGTYNGGFALRPLLANLHIFRIGFALTPFDWTDGDFFKRMTLVAKYSYYMKNRESAAINYGNDALLNDRDVGHGLDLTLRWRIYYDLAAFVNYGLFVPGAAYSSEEPNRHFLMAGITISF
jgi:hypothetical protein